MAYVLFITGSGYDRVDVELFVDHSLDVIEEVLSEYDSEFIDMAFHFG